MTLGDLLSKTSNVDKSTIMVSLYDANNLLLITFSLSGYNNLDDWLVNEQVAEVEIIDESKINITLKENNQEEEPIYNENGEEEL